MKNIFTIDVEEFYQGTEFDNRDRWSQYQHHSRVGKNTLKLLELLGKHGATATFFILDDVTARHPELVKEIAARGHEVAVHGVSHLPMEKLTPEQFENEVIQSRERLTELISSPPIGYRAPFFTMRRDMNWAREVLIHCGFKYDSSIFPIYNYLGGDPGAPRFPFDWGGLLEVPISTLSFLRVNLPFSGGFYLRCLPLGFVALSIKRLNRLGQPAVVYLHPREIDPDQPRLKMTLKQELFYYFNLKGVREKMRRLLNRFEFQSIREAYQLGR